MESGLPDMTLRTVDLGDCTVRVTVTGSPDAPPLILVHGWASSQGVWDNTVAALSDRFYCITLDLPGFGESPRSPDGDCSIEAQGKRVLALADHLGFDHFYLAGHSMGGMIALCIASQLAPERVLAAISVAGVMAGRAGPLAEFLAPLLRIPYYLPFLIAIPRWLSRFPAFSRLFFRILFYDMHAMPYAMWESDRHAALFPGIHIPAFRSLQAIHACDLTDSLADVRVPALAIHGRQDRLVGYRDSQLLHARVANSRLLLLNRCGHYPMYEQPGAYLAALTGFLDDACRSQTAGSTPHHTVSEATG